MNNQAHNYQVITNQMLVDMHSSRLTSLAIAKPDMMAVRRFMAKELAAIEAEMVSRSIAHFPTVTLLHTVEHRAKEVAAK